MLNKAFHEGVLILEGETSDDNNHLHMLLVLKSTIMNEKQNRGVGSHSDY